MSQERLINYIESILRNSEENLDEWSTTLLTVPESMSIGNIQTSIKWHTKETRDPLHMQHCKTFLELDSYCNEHNCESGIGLVTFPDVESRPKLWEVHIANPNLLHMLGLKKFSGRRQYYTDYHVESDSESSIHKNIDEIPEVYHEVDTHVVGIECGDGVQNITGCDTEDIKSLLLTSYQAISNEIIFLLLCGKRSEKWTSLDVESLMKDILCSPKHIFKELTVYEIDGILRVLQRYSSKKCPLLIKPKMKKLTKANFLGHVLGHYKRYLPSRKKMKEMQTLASICRDEVVRSVPEDVMWVGLALWTLRYDIQDWLNKSPVPITFDLPVPPHEFDIFSYPDMSIARSQVESKIIDPSHCLTNLHVHATMKGFFGCDPKAFQHISTADNNVLSKGLLVEPLQDKQSIPFALKVFSSAVEQTMHNNGDIKEAELVKHVHNWYSACNDRGITVTEHLRSFVAMNNYMLSFYKPRLFPMSTTHVCGLPSVTLQAILHNISTRIQLYALSRHKKYNQRAVSTLAIESMFSVLTTLL